MKKTILLFILSVLTLSVNAQNKDLSKYIHEEKTVSAKTHSVKPVKEGQIQTEAQSHIYKAGDYLEKSGRYQFGAIGSAALSGIFIAVGANKTEDGNETVRKSMYGIGGVLGVASLVFTIVSIDYKIRAGKELKLGASGNGASMAYIF